MNARLGRKDLTEANIKAAMEQIPYEQIRNAILNQLASGKAHYQESYLLSEIMESSNAIGERAGIQLPEAEGMSISDPYQHQESGNTRYTHIIRKGFAEMGSILHGSVLLYEFFN